MNGYTKFLDLFLGHLARHTDSIKQKQPVELYEPESYILSLGGKRLRPLLALMACDLFGKKPELALDSALAVEMFHNFSLIHDDILDDAPLRRNKPTVHVKWNSNIAILSGDVMLVKAFQVLENYSDSEFRQLTSLLHKTAIEVCEGQQMDMNFESIRDVSVSDYIKMITNKTAVLLGCSLRMGAINAGAPLADQEQLMAYGLHLGISFQLLDDLLDAFADPEKFGKQVGGDILSNKKTFLILKAKELANKDQNLAIEKAMAEKDPSLKVAAMLSIYRDLGVEELCRAEAQKHTDQALGCLGKIDAEAGKKNALIKFTHDLLKRQV